MKLAVFSNLTRRRRALALPALFVLMQVRVALPLEAPGLDQVAPADKGAPSSNSTAAELVWMLEPRVPLDLPTLEMPLFDRAQGLFLSWRGTASRSQARPFSDLLKAHFIKLFSDEDEMRNVRLAAEAVDGIVLAPYETFSFNEIVGRRTERKGYRPGLMFAEGQVVSGIGGGICIVSTALYNAALHSGLKIIERSPHSGRVRYAGPGLDAAIFYGSRDLKFKNDTGAPLLIQAIVDGRVLTVRFFGHRPPGQEIELVSQGYREIPYKVIEKPEGSLPEGEEEVVAEARSGYEVTTLRVFKQDGRVVRREVIAHSVVPPRDKVVLVPKPNAPEPLLSDLAPAAEPPQAAPADPEPPPPGLSEEYLSPEEPEGNC